MGFCATQLYPSSAVIKQFLTVLTCCGHWVELCFSLNTCCCSEGTVTQQVTVLLPAAPQERERIMSRGKTPQPMRDKGCRTNKRWCLDYYGAVIKNIIKIMMGGVLFQRETSLSEGSVDVSLFPTATAQFIYSLIMNTVSQSITGNTHTQQPLIIIHAH